MSIDSNACATPLVPETFVGTLVAVTLAPSRPEAVVDRCNASPEGMGPCHRDEPLRGRGALDFPRNKTGCGESAMDRAESRGVSAANCNVSKVLMEGRMRQIQDGVTEYDPIRVTLVEDNPDDAELVKKTLRAP